jgi:cystathionine beta-lyase
MHLGFGVAANDVELVLRSLPSLPVRYHAQDAVGRELAAWLALQPAISRVLHPAFDSCPGHAHWKDTCTAAAGRVSVMVDARYSSTQVDAFVDALRLFKLGYSWAGPVSLVVPYDLRAMRGDKAYPGTLVRFSIGLESAAALKADLEQALAVLG